MHAAAAAAAGGCGLNDDTLMNKEVPSVRYYQQFVLRSHTFHASYLLQHYYIAATCRSEPLSTSRAKNVKPARSGCAPASAMIKIEKKTSSDLSTVVVTDCKIYDYMYINPQWHIT